MYKHDWRLMRSLNDNRTWNEFVQKCADHCTAEPRWLLVAWIGQLEYGLLTVLYADCGLKWIQGGSESLDGLLVDSVSIDEIDDCLRRNWGAWEALAPSRHPQ